jgi:tetratricopeptide (TPR) repeat protein
MRRSLALLLLLCAAVATNLFAVGEARITGKILDSVSKQPLPDATIVVVSAPGSGKNFKQEYKPNKEGTYAIFLLDGTIKYSFTVSAPGHAPYEETMKLKLGEPNNRDFELSAGVAAPSGVALKSAAVDPAVIAYNEGAGLANEGKDAEAIAKIEEAVKAKPDLTAGWSALAKLYLRGKNYPKAIDCATKSLAIDSEDVDMNAVLYESYIATGDKAKAAEHKAKLPADSHSLFNDAAKLINAGKDAEAEPLLKQAVTIDEKFGQAYYELGMVYVRTGKNDLAKTTLQKYLEIEPNGKDAATAREMMKYLK